MFAQVRQIRVSSLVRHLLLELSEVRGFLFGVVLLFRQRGLTVEAPSVWLLALLLSEDFCLQLGPFFGPFFAFRFLEEALKVLAVGEAQSLAHAFFE